MKYLRPFLILALIGVFAIVAWWCGPRAFPLANVDFSLTRGDAETTMKKFVESLGHPLEGYMSTSTFGEDSDVKHFVELEYGVPRLEEMNREGMSVWYWGARWFKPGQHEEFSAWVDTQGGLVGYSETIKEEEALPALDRDAALALAERFLVDHVPRHPAAARKLESDSVEEKPHRKDYSFTWEQENLRLGDAPYRLTVTVYGNRVGEYGEGLKVPELWTRDYDQKREVNELCSAVAGYASTLLFLGIGVFFVRGIMRHTIQWKHAMPWGWLLVFAFITLASSINSVSDTLYYYQTTQAWPAFVTEEVLSAVQQVIFVVSSFWLLFLVADAVQRERLPGSAPLSHVLGRHALRDPKVVRAMGVGILAALGGYAYVSAFYVVGARFGVWAPVDVDSSKVLTGYLPWIEPMRIGLEAAFSEEFLFRIIAILLLWWVLRVRWLAVLIAAAVWAFLHSTYPQMPGYIRGIELTVEGVIWGVLFLRYGIVSTLTAHYLYNCWLASMIVVQSASWVDRIGAVAVASWPVALYLWARWKGHRHEVEIHETMQAPPLVPTAELTSWNFPPVRLACRQILTCCAFASLLMAAMWLLPLAQARIQALGEHDFSREQIEASADAIMRGKGYDPAGYKRTTISSTNSLPSIGYMTEHGTLDALARFFEAEWPDVVWSVRYFKILEKEEFTVRLDKHGNLYRWVHRILKEEPGADLDKDAALALIEQTLAKDYGMDFAKEKLITIDPTKQENRRDYHAVFERDDIGWGEARLRTSLSLQGDEPVMFSRWVKIPEAWSREKRKSGWRETISGEFRNWTMLGFGVVAGVFLILLIRRHVIPWRLAFLLGLFPLALTLVNTLNELPYFFSGYSTTTPLANFLIMKSGRILISFLGSYIGGVVMVAVSLGVARLAFGAQAREIAWWPGDKSERTRFLLQTLAVVFFSVVCFRFESFARNLVAGYSLPTWAGGIGSLSINEAWPWLDAVTASLSTGFSGVFRIAIVAGVVALAVRRWGRPAWCVLFLLPVLGAASAESWTEFIYTVATGEMRIALLVFLTICFWRFNPMAIFLSYFIAELTGWLLVIWEKGGPHYRWDVVPVLFLLAAGIVAVLGAHSRSRHSPTTNT